METIKIIIQIAISFTIFNVWIFRFSKPTKWRGKDAQNMNEEFNLYGLNSSFLKLVGFLKLSLAVLLIVGIFIPEIVIPTSIGMAVLMSGAISMHIKVQDPIIKSLPAFTMLMLSIILIFI